MSAPGKTELEELLKEYISGEKEISPEDYTGSESETGMYAYLNLFTAASDGETYLAATTKVRRHNSYEVATGRSLNFTWNLKRILNLTTDYSKTVRQLTDFAKELLLVWREHNNLDLQKGTSLEDIT